ncbi:DUF4351 domain-containing protein [Laspinema olomoucense]|uniref:DUF4351 domain-containing protein n=1 Tax=Laspinema olomoucense TaxID=3231600 RepID=UPI0021BAF10C|nr:DUF4351 domain-containing protein [Laspinema sp. D3a]MCT7987895.1 DUF4351 domain-containing protein [Laspinema sp. D3a]
MQESVIYQDILQKGLNQGKKQEAIAMIMRPITRRFGSLEPDIRDSIDALTTAQLEDLNEALFDFTEVTDLVTWLASR